MATEKSSASAQPSTEDYDDTVEAHYAGLNRPHACNDGWITLGEVDENGLEFTYLVRCKRCEAKGC
jgi:hypothetical protein